MEKLNYFLMFFALAAVVLLAAACTGGSSGLSNLTGSNVTGDTTQKVKFSDTSLYANAYLISGDSLGADAQQAMAGFSMQKTPQQDGTTMITLTSTNPEYNDQSYILQPGEKLYFIERMPGDDSDGQDVNLGDDFAVIVDSQGYIVRR